MTNMKHGLKQDCKLDKKMKGIAVNTKTIDKETDYCSEVTEFWMIKG